MWGLCADTFAEDEDDDVDEADEVDAAVADGVEAALGTAGDMAIGVGGGGGGTAPESRPKTSISSPCEKSRSGMACMFAALAMTAASDEFEVDDATVVEEEEDEEPDEWPGNRWCDPWKSSCSKLSRSKFHITDDDDEDDADDGTDAADDEPQEGAAEVAEAGDDADDESDLGPSIVSWNNASHSLFRSPRVANACESKRKKRKRGRRR